MESSVAHLSELHAALLQGAVTLGAAALCGYLYAKYRRRYLLWLTVAWSLYVLRIAVIVAFLTTAAQPWLFLHQVFTGWTALALLWAALTLLRSPEWRPWYGLAAAFPVVWSYVAIYELHNFMLAAAPAVLFLSMATLWTGWVFFAHWRRTGSRGGVVLAVVLTTWALHHLNYPLLRARGAWNPWGYYLDILFVLAMGIGIVILLLDELDDGLRAMLVLSGELPTARGGDRSIDTLLERVNTQLATRTRQLETLSTQMVERHEEERRQLSLALHDQSAQVWAAVKLQLGLVREAAPAEATPQIDRALALVDAGIQSIRSVTTQLRPPLLDDLGLLPALRALVHTFSEQASLEISFESPRELPPVSRDAGLALFRSLQEALSNVARHSGATRVHVRLGVANGQLTLVVHDNGRGVSHADFPSAGTLGLTGMRERIGALRGSVTLDNGAPAAASGARLTVRLPLVEA